MTRVWSAVRFLDGEIKYAVYDGSTDRLLPKLLSTVDEVLPVYYSGADLSLPSSVQPDSGEPVTIYCDYGDGSLWDGTATRDYVTSECELLRIEDARDCNWVKPHWLPRWLRDEM